MKKLVSKNQIIARGGAECRLYEEFKALLAPMPKLRYREWVGLPRAVGRAPFRDLLALERAGETRYIGEHGIFSLSEVLKIMPKEEREKQSREIHFHGPGVYQENGSMADVTLGNKTIILGQAQELAQKLGDLHYTLGVEVEDEQLRAQALRELEMIRQALRKIQAGDADEKRTALDTLSHFGDKAKEGAGKTVEALKSLKEGGEALEWVMEKAPAIIAAMAGFLG
jgi:hypothetical protein